jgi:hypothetical protein
MKVFYIFSLIEILSCFSFFRQDLNVGIKINNFLVKMVEYSYCIGLVDEASDSVVEGVLFIKCGRR